MKKISTDLRRKGLRAEGMSLLHAARIRVSSDCPSPPRHRFMIYGQGRNGSTLLVSLLNSHPEVSCLGETLHYPALAPVSMIRRELRYRLSTPYRGFKLLSYHMRSQMDARRTKALREMVETDGISVIHVERHNLLRLALSNIYARRRQAFHSYQSGAEAAKMIEVSPEELFRWMQGAEKVALWERDWLGDLPHQKISYEDDLATPGAQQASMDRVLGNFGLTPVEVGTTLRPVTPRDFPSFVSNWDEISSSLKGTPYEKFITA